MSRFLVPRVKVCGLARPADAALAYTAGADAFGVVHHAPSPRSLDAVAAREVVAELPFGAPAVAVLVDRTPEEAQAFATAAGVAAVQLCGAERAADFAGFPLPLLRRIGVGPGAEEEMAAWSGAAAFVLDHPSSAGGSGRAVDFGRAAALVAAAGATPCLLAGGLGPDNVAAAVAAVRPHGVDASSRLEAAPGCKDPVLVRAFVAAASAALREIRP